MLKITSAPSPEQTFKPIDVTIRIESTREMDCLFALCRDILNNNASPETLIVFANQLSPHVHRL